MAGVSDIDDKIVERAVEGFDVDRSAQANRHRNVVHLRWKTLSAIPLQWKSRQL
jgi:hypothetical protein